MKKLTRKQRAEIYLRVSIYMLNKNYQPKKKEKGLCYLVNILHDNTHNCNIERFPELELFRPFINEKDLGTPSARWWHTEDINSRITCMLLCYEMCINP